MSIPCTTSINAAIQELSNTINTLARFFPEGDKGATAAMLTATTAQAHLRDALEAAALAGAQPSSTPAASTPKHQTANYPFFSCNHQKDKLFSVRGGIPQKGALEQASLFLDSAQAIAGIAEDVTPAVVYGAAYLIEMARAVVDATAYVVHAEEMGEGQP